MNKSTAPAVIIITGPSGAGKTTLGQKIATALHLPFFYRDGIKEQLFDSLGWSDVDWSSKLGGASYDLLYYTARQLIRVGSSVVLESNFTKFSEQTFKDIQKEYHCRYIQIVITADPAILKNRFEERVTLGNRHPGHNDHLRSDIFTPELLEKHTALSLDCPVINIDTTDFSQVNLDAVIASIQSILKS